jgi:DNA polymerase III delta prime subunit
LQVTYCGFLQGDLIHGIRDRAVYRCDGQLIYKTVSKQEREQLPHLEEPTLPESIKVKSLMDLEPASEDDDNTLLGDRWLCRGGGGLFIGPTGVGKTTAAIQLALAWSFGAECFGIKPGRALKILYIQSENDEGDLCEMRDGALKSAEVTQVERDLIQQNFIVVFESAHTGEEFVDVVLRPLIAKYRPDLVIFDTGLAYLGGDANKQDVVGGFLRNFLTPVLQEYQCGVFIIHHTAKPTTRVLTTQSGAATDYAYLGTGSSEWANWARGVLILSGKDKETWIRELRIGKRFRLGWRDGYGERTLVKLLQQNVSEDRLLFFEELSDEEAAAIDDNLSIHDKIIARKLLPAKGEEISKNALVTKIVDSGICKERKAKEEIDIFVIDSLLEQFEQKRSGKRPEVWVRGV